MNDIIQSLTKEQIGEVIQLFDPYMDDYLYIMDLQNDFFRISEHAVERFRLPAASFHDAMSNHRLFVYEEDLPLLNDDFLLMLNGQKKKHNLHYRWLDKNGQPVWINCRGGVVNDKNGKPRYLIGCINETGKKQRADNTSGLLGELELLAYIMNYQEKISSGFFMHIGIDDCGSINGTLGIAYGDYVIKNVAACIKECLSERQQLFHIVADEYMIVDLGNHTSEDAVLLYKNIRKKLLTFIDSENYKSVFTVSAGILDAAIVADNYDEILKLSDFTLKRAKEDGKNCFYVFNQEDYARFLRKRKIAMGLHHAVDNDFHGFEVYYQPIVDCITNQIFGAEALMRFSLPKEDGKERISPFEFIPILEETGLILPAGRWILNEAAAMCNIYDHELMIRIIEMAHSLNLQICVEGVEKTEVLEEVKKIHADYIQGYLFGQPCSKTEFYEKYV